MSGQQSHLIKGVSSVEDDGWQEKIEKDFGIKGLLWKKTELLCWWLTGLRGEREDSVYWTWLTHTRTHTHARTHRFSFAGWCFFLVSLKSSVTIVSRYHDNLICPLFRKKKKKKTHAVNRKMGKWDNSGIWTNVQAVLATKKIGFHVPKQKSNIFSTTHFSIATRWCSTSS